MRSTDAVLIVGGLLGFAAACLGSIAVASTFTNPDPYRPHNQLEIVENDSPGRTEVRCGVAVDDTDHRLDDIGGPTDIDEQRETDVAIVSAAATICGSTIEFVQSIAAQVNAT